MYNKNMSQFLNHKQSPTDQPFYQTCYKVKTQHPTKKKQSVITKKTNKLSKPTLYNTPEKRILFTPQTPRKINKRRKRRRRPIRNLTNIFNNLSI